MVGLWHSAVDVASQFIKEDVVMYEQFGDGTLKTEHANKSGLAQGYSFGCAGE